MVKASAVLSPLPLAVTPAVYVPASIVCAAPLYSTIKLHVSAVGIAGLAVLAVCKVPVPLVDVGLPPSKLVPIFNILPLLMLRTALTLIVPVAVLSPVPLIVKLL